MDVPAVGSEVVVLVHDPRLRDLSDECDPPEIFISELQDRCVELAGKGGGSIVLVMSQQMLQGDEAFPRSSLQAAAAQQALALLSRKYGPSNVRINAVAYRDFLSAQLPALWLLSSEASFVTGQMLTTASPP